MESQQPSPTRLSNACELCRRRKVKCSGNQPCRNCNKHNVECIFLAPGRYSISYVQSLLTTIKRQEEQLRTASRYQAASPLPAVGNPEVSLPLTATPPTPSQAGGPTAVSPASVASAERATGPAFERRIRSLLHSHAEKDQHHVADGRVLQPIESAEPLHANENPWRSTMEVLDGADDLILPSEAESRRLLDLFLSIMGVNQHFLDPRTFVDTMTLLFQSDTSRQNQMGTMWFIQYLLVMAMGKLLDFDTQSSKTFPGAPYFAEAVRRLPPLYQLGAHGCIVVEILCLVSVYLQWCDRKHDAYLYIGTAMRLAIALGLPLPYHEQECLPSERAHRIRVWWTAFMLDRRLAAGIGLPVAADDRQLSAELPSPAPGFVAPEALIINVKVARATGDIMTCLYGNTAISELGLVQNIQNILSSLYKTGSSIPVEYAIDFKNPNLTVTRTGASLYLMLLQAIILCIRPILLQRVKDKVTASLEGAPLPNASLVVGRLCYTCGESATKCLRICHALQRSGEIARFGYFDLDATYFSALTLAMIGFIDANDKIPAELHQATEVLRYLAGAGNKAAEKRLRDIHQFCNHVWPDTPFERDSLMASPTVNTDIQDSRGDVDQQKPSEDCSQTSVVLSPPGRGRDDMGDPLETQSDFRPFSEYDPVYGFGVDLVLEAGGIYSSFRDPNLPLTGVDQLDWAEMDRIFTVRTM